LRLVLDVEVKAGNEHSSVHSAPALWGLLDRLGRDRWPWLLRGDADFGTERILSRAEQEGMPYLFKLRSTRNVKRLIEKAMGEADWTAAGQGWQGKASTLRLQGWSRHRRVIILRRRLAREVLVTDRPGGPAPQLALSFAEVTEDRAVYEYAVLVTALDLEVLSVAQLYRDRADAENGFDEIKNQWGWGGFTTHDLQRCRVMARCVVYNWWSLFGRSRPPHGSHYQPTTPVAWRGAANPPCRSDDPDHHQCPRVSWKGSGRLDADCRLLCPASVNCGAVDDRTALVPDPQPSPRSLPEREPSATSAAPCSNLTPARTACTKVENPRRPIDSLPVNCRI
jgi:hypothetical protein